MWDTLTHGPLDWLFIEFREFSEFRDHYFMTDENFARFQVSLTRKPDSGDVMPGCGGLRKARWIDPRRGKGKRGGLRVIYLLVPEVRVVVLADVYDKDESDDLTLHEKQELTTLAMATRKALMKRHDARKGERT